MTAHYTGFLSHVTFATERSIIALSINMILFPTVAVALRFYVRRVQKVPLLIDDWLTLPSLTMVVGMTISVIIGAKKHALGYTTHYPNAPLSVIVEFACELMQICALGCVKLSILFFYRRIFCTPKIGPFHYIPKSSIILVAAWSIAFFFAFFFMCGKYIDAHWGTIEDLVTKCGESLSLQMGLAISDFIMDIMIVIMPLPMLWRLHITLSRKFALTGVFLLGAVAVAASATRMVIYIIAAKSRLTPGIDPDVDIADAYYWVMFECGFALIAACLPTLRFLFGKFSPDALIRSIRSAISLNSLRSQRSQHSDRILLTAKQKVRSFL